MHTSTSDSGDDGVEDVSDVFLSAFAYSGAPTLNASQLRLQQHQQQLQAQQHPQQPRRYASLPGGTPGGLQSASTDQLSSCRPSSGDEAAASPVSSDGSSPTAVRNQPIEFAQAMSNTLKCGICMDVFMDPVIVPACGHTFCRGCILHCVSPTGGVDVVVCPLCRKRSELAVLQPNIALSALISEFPVYCRFRSFGCRATVPLAGLPEHESACKNAPDTCPHARTGCSFKGSRNELRQHLRLCTFEQMKGFIEVTQRSISSLTDQVVQQGRELAQLRELVRRLVQSSSDSVTMQRVLHAAAKDDAFAGVIAPEPDPSAAAAVASSSSQSPTHAATPQPPSSSSSAAVTPAYLAGASMASLLSDWDPLSVDCQRTIATAHKRAITSLATACGAPGILFSGSHDAAIAAWDLQQEAEGAMDFPERARKEEAHGATVWALEWVPDRDTLFSCSADGTIKAWDCGKGSIAESQSKRMAHDGKIYELQHEANMLFSASADRTVKAWDTRTNQCVGEMQGHREGVWCVELSNDKNTLISGCNAGQLRLWDIRSGFRCSHFVTTHDESPVLDVATAGGYVFCGTSSCRVSVYAEHDLGHVQDLAGHKWEVWQVQVVEGHVVSASFDHTMKLWRIGDGFPCLKTLRGHTGVLHALCTAPGALGPVYSGSGDRSIKCWWG